MSTETYFRSTRPCQGAIHFGNCAVCQLFAMNGTHTGAIYINNLAESIEEAKTTFRNHVQHSPYDGLRHSAGYYVSVVVALAHELEQLQAYVRKEKEWELPPPPKPSDETLAQAHLRRLADRTDEDLQDIAHDRVSELDPDIRSRGYEVELKELNNRRNAARLLLGMPPYPQIES